MPTPAEPRKPYGRRIDLESIARDQWDIERNDPSYSNEISRIDWQGFNRPSEY